MSLQPKRDDDIDYRIKNQSQQITKDPKYPLWQFGLYGLLILIFLTTLAIINNLNSKINYIQQQNSVLRAVPRGEGTSLYPESSKRTFYVKGEPAICVQGTWNEQNEWDETADTTTLIWSKDKTPISIIQSGQGYSCDDLGLIQDRLKK